MSGSSVSFESPLELDAPACCVGVDASALGAVAVAEDVTGGNTPVRICGDTLGTFRMTACDPDLSCCSASLSCSSFGDTDDGDVTTMAWDSGNGGDGLVVLSCVTAVVGTAMNLTGPRDSTRGTDVGGVAIVAGAIGRSFLTLLGVEDVVGFLGAVGDVFVTVDDGGWFDDVFLAVFFGQLAFVLWGLGLAFGSAVPDFG